MSVWRESDRIVDNLVRENGEHGIVLEEHSDENVLERNVVESNLADGVRLEKADENGVTENSVTGNAASGILLKDADDNVVDQNTIAGNGDGLTNEADCVSGNGNTGSNVTPACQ